MKKYQVVGFAVNGTITHIIEVQHKNPGWKPRQIKKHMLSTGKATKRVTINIINR